MSFNNVPKEWPNKNSIRDRKSFRDLLKLDFNLTIFFFEDNFLQKKNEKKNKNKNCHFYLLEILEEKEKAFKDVENRLQKLNSELSTSNTDNRYAYELKRELEEKRRSLAYDIYYMRDKNGLCQSSSTQSLCRHYDRISRGW